MDRGDFDAIDKLRAQFNQAYSSGAQNAACINPAPQEKTPREALFHTHIVLTDRAREIMHKKNHDYASVSDPYRNFRTFGLLGILVRMSDKLARLRTFEEQGVTKVADESIQDTIVDLINYAVIFEAMRREYGVTEG
jgi:hypothetical protein